MLLSFRRGDLPQEVKVWATLRLFRNKKELSWPKTRLGKEPHMEVLLRFKSRFLGLGFESDCAVRDRLPAKLRAPPGCIRRRNIFQLTWHCLGVPSQEPAALQVLIQNPTCSLTGQGPIQIWNLLSANGHLMAVGSNERRSQMNKQFSSQRTRSTEVRAKEVADYFGLPVEVICRMQHCTLIRYRDRESIVKTKDLDFGRSLKCAAKCAA